jgi:multidrug efflux system membrane fusion protein
MWKERIDLITWRKARLNHQFNLHHGAQRIVGVRVSGVGLLLTMILGWLPGCSRAPPPERDVTRPVKTIVVVAGEELRTRSFPGTAEASRRVELAFRVPGLLAELPVKEGDMVATGDLIARLRQDEFTARLAAVQGELDQARSALQAARAGERPEEIRRREAELRAAAARLENARVEHGRNTRLVRDNVITRSAFDQSQTRYRVAQEEVTAAQKSLDQASIGREEDIEALEGAVRGLEARVVEAQIQLEDSTLLAPYDGVIAQRFVDQGQNMAVGARVVQFQDVEEIDIAVDVPETVMAAEIQRADIVRMTARLSAAPGVEFPVRIREIAQVADPATQTFNVRVAMEAQPNIRVLPGMSANVTVEYRRAAILGERMLIPIEAVGETAGGQQVAWVLDAEGQGESANGGAVSSRPVKLGAASGGRIEVVDGLQPGDRIVVAGVRFLREGMRVRDLGNALGESPQ